MNTAITYEQFVARATQDYGEDWAQRHAADYGRNFALTARSMAETADPDNAAALRRVANMMDPDRRPSSGDRSGPTSRA
ncbi:hypothetical protein [Streptomyces griseosporeus]